MVHADQALGSLHSCNVGVATPIFFMSNKLAETTKILVINASLPSNELYKQIMKKQEKVTCFEARRI